MTTIVTKYVIFNKEEKAYLDYYDCETEDISNSVFYDSFTEAEEYRKDIDVAYLYETIPVEVSYMVDSNHNINMK